MDSPNSNSSTIRLALRDLAWDGVRLHLTGECMSPHIKPDTEYTVRRRRFYWPGDVIVFEARDGTLTTHRLLGVYMRDGVWKLLTQADTAERPDFAVPTEQLIGRVEGVPPRRLFALGRYLRFCLRR